MVDELKAFNDSLGNKIHIECISTISFLIKESHKIQTDMEQITFKKALFLLGEKSPKYLTFKIRCCLLRLD